MATSIKWYLQSVLRRIEYTGTGQWIYTRRVLQWVEDPCLTRQLPFGLRLFCAYCRLYIRFLRFPTIVFGHGIYTFSRWFSKTEIQLGHRAMSIDGMTVYLDLRDPGALSSIHELAGRSELRSALEFLLKPGCTFVDVGANQGVFALIAAKVLGSEGRIIAIEPQSALADCVELSLAASDANNWRVYRCAVSDEARVGAMSVPAENNGEARLERKVPEPTGTIVAVGILDKLLEDVEPSQSCIMKMDIEGAEVEALRGGRDFIERVRPTLLIEINPEACMALGHSTQELCMELGSLGYRQWSRLDALDNRETLTSMPLDRYTDVVLWHE